MWRKLQMNPAGSWQQLEVSRAMTAGETSPWFANGAFSDRDATSSQSPRLRGRTGSSIFLSVSSLVLTLSTTGLPAADSSIQQHLLMAEYNVAWQLEGQGKPDEAIPRLKAVIA